MIKENRFDELKQELNNSESELKIYHLIFRILNNEKIEEVEKSHRKDEIIEESNDTAEQSEKTGFFSRVIKYLKKS